MITAQKIISYILSILLVICLCLTVILINLNFTVLNKENIKNIAHKSNYYNGIYKIIIDLWHDTTMPSGFETSITDDIVNIEYVEKDINNLIDALYENKEVNVNTKEIREKLDKNIEKYIEDNDLEVNKTTQKNIKVYKDSIESTYKKSITYSNDIVKEAAKYMKIVQGALKIATGIAIGISLIIAIGIFILNKASVGVALLSTGILFILANIFSNINIAIHNILILNRPFSEFAITTIEQLMHWILIDGIVFSVVGVLWIVVFNLLHLNTVTQK